ncbi:condensation domain-containing protein, partial [Nonomuraea jabiensis]|uniref:condensation domain-containing protein n=1 Tax=Nonomuraea jabiensis TaxID=882448 RepID=UPI003D70EA6A
MAGDGWSLAPLTRDLVEAYSARREGRALEWAPLPVQYADYTLWQRDVLGDDADPGSVFGRQLAYWRDRLAGLPEELVLPGAGRRPVGEGAWRGDFVVGGVEPVVWAAVVGCARRWGVTPFMVLHAALAGLFARLGVGTDVVVGSPIAGRLDVALDDLVGFFVNSLVLRTDVSGDPSFGELLGRVRESSLAAYAHQDVPFEYVVEAVNPRRVVGRHPLFQVALVVQNAGGGDFRLPGLVVRQLVAGTGTARFDVLVSVSEGVDGGASVLVEYATGVYGRESIGVLLDRWVRVLGQWVVDPSLRVSDVE